MNITGIDDGLSNLLKMCIRDSLKGPKHGGANHKVMEMLGYIMEGVKDHSDDAEIAAFLRRLQMCIRDRASPVSDRMGQGMSRP